AGRGGGGGLDVTLDGVPVQVRNPRNFRLPVTAGPHVLGVALVDGRRGAGVNEIYSDFRVNAEFTSPGGVQSVTIVGPHDPTGAGEPPARRRISVSHPAQGDGEAGCARRILSTLARRAYRGPVTEAEVATLMGFFDEGRRQGDFETGIQSALARMLVAPRFIF